MNTTAKSFHLTAHRLTVTEVHRNLPPSALYEHAIRFEKDASIAENGALVAYSGVKTGRSPKDKRVVKSFGTPDFVIYNAGAFPASWTSSGRCASARCSRTWCSMKIMTSITPAPTSQTTRRAYPIAFIQNAKIPCSAGHPTEGADGQLHPAHP
jgi:ATP-dependent phosphoenolpyruvate carboxykinase